MEFSKFTTVTWTPSLNLLLTCKKNKLMIKFRYDFDKDGYIIKEDVRLILSHVPITNTVSGKTSEEGTFT